MSLVITVFVPEGIVMASDSRQSITIGGKSPDGRDINVETVNSDAVTKTFLLAGQNVGISNYGQDMINGIPMASHIRSFIEESIVVADDVSTIPNKLIEHFRKIAPKADAGFHIAGYKKEGRTSTPYVFRGHIASNKLERLNTKSNNAIFYGASWSGQIDILASIINPVITKDEKGQDKVIRGPAPIIWDAMTLQDAIDFAMYAIRTTIDTMRFQARPKNVGGPIDVLMFTTTENPRWIQSKEYHGKSIR